MEEEHIYRMPNFQPCQNSSPLFRTQPPIYKVSPIRMPSARMVPGGGVSFAENDIPQIGSARRLSLRVSLTTFGSLFACCSYVMAGLVLRQYTKFAQNRFGGYWVSQCDVVKAL